MSKEREVLFTTPTEEKARGRRHIRRRLARLIGVKPFIAIVVTLIFAYMSIAGSVSSEIVMGVVLMVIGFYFGKEDRDEEE